MKNLSGKNSEFLFYFELIREKRGKNKYKEIEKKIQT
jgi:hypothetical protein